MGYNSLCLHVWDAYYFSWIIIVCVWVQVILVWIGNIKQCNREGERRYPGNSKYYNKDGFQIVLCS